MGVNEAFYALGKTGCYLPTEHTGGPWNARFQHGGPPAALLAREIERCLIGEQLRIGRITYEILGPVPMLPLRASAAVRRPGKRVRLIEATLSADRPVIVASAWAILPAPAGLPAEPTAQRVPGPEGLAVTDPTAFPEWNCGFLAATEWRFVHGSYHAPGPAGAWIRSRLPLLADEPLSPTQRAALTADSANGVSGALDIRTWMFIPPELTIHFLRPADGEWLYLDAASLVQPDAVGLATATLHDRRGPVARCAQALYVAGKDHHA